MKKLTYLLSALLIASIGLVGCDNAEDNEGPSYDNWTVTIGGKAITSESAYAMPGDSIVIMTKISDDDEIKTYSVKLTGADTKTFADEKSWDKATASVTVRYKVTTAAKSQLTFSFSATDNDDKTISKTFVVIVDAGIKTTKAKLLGGQSSSVGSFYSVGSDSVFTQANAKANSTLIDFVYYYVSGTNANLATLAGPNDAEAKTKFDNNTTGLQTWDKTNDTKFVSTSVDFSNTALAVSIENAFSAGTSTTKATKLSVGSVFAFKTEGGKYGILKVTKVTGTESGSIEILVKTAN